MGYCIRGTRRYPGYGTPHTSGAQDRIAAPRERSARHPHAGLIAASLLVTSAVNASEPTPAQARQLLAAMPLYFVENCGQADCRIAYSIQRGGYRVLFSTEG